MKIYNFLGEYLHKHGIWIMRVGGWVDELVEMSDGGAARQGMVCWWDGEVKVEPMVVVHPASLPHPSHIPPLPSKGITSIESHRWRYKGFHNNKITGTGLIKKLFLESIKEHLIIAVNFGAIYPYTFVLLVVVMFEECGEATAVGAAFSSSTTLLLPLPCGGGQPPDLSSVRSNLPPSSPVVVIASCPVIAMVASGLDPNNTLLGASPSVILPVPASNSPVCPAHRQATSPAVIPATDPIERALDILLSWMTYHSWKTLTVLYDRSHEPSTFAYFCEY